MDDRDYLRQRMAAALAALQPGIDPAFLVLLSGDGQIEPANHGLIMAVTQFGTMLGALVCWRAAERMGRGVAIRAAGLMLVTALATAATNDLALLIVERGIYGACSGLIFTRAMAAAAARDARHAFGTMFLLQLLLSAAVAPLLMWIAAGRGAPVALATLALCPLTILLLLLAECADTEAPVVVSPAGLPARSAGEAGPARAGLAAAFLFICVTMVVWSHVGAAAVTAGVSEAAIGSGVGLGSLAGAVPAVAASYLRERVPVLAAGIVCAAGTLTPLLIPAGLGAAGFIAVLLLFNIGSTYAVIRSSALAVQLNATPANRRAVAAMHPLAMTAGPLVGFAAVRLGGDAGWGAAAACCAAAALGALALARLPRGPLCDAAQVCS